MIGLFFYIIACYALNTLCGELHNVFNAEGKILDLPYNRPLMDENGLPYDIVCGTFFLAGVGAEDFVYLTDDQIQRYKSLYDNVLVITAEKQAHQKKKSKPKER